MGTGPLQNGEKPITHEGMTTPNPLIAEIEKFLRTRGVNMSETAFGLAAMNDGKFLATLRDGRRVWPDTAEKVRAFMADELASLRSAHARRRTDKVAA